MVPASEIAVLVLKILNPAETKRIFPAVFMSNCENNDLHGVVA